MTFISCAKTMTARTKIKYPETTIPHFQEEARKNALYMNQFTAEELGQILKVNAKLAAENRLRYQDFLSPDTPSLPALLAYTGMVFKRIHPADFTPEDFQFAQQHLLITSFLYGLLRPLDAIKNYRMEGNVRPAGTPAPNTVRLLETDSDRLFHRSCPPARRYSD